MFDDDDDARRIEAAEAAAAQAEDEWRHMNLSLLEDVLKALGPTEVLRHVAEFISRPKRDTTVVSDDVEPF